MSNPRIISPYHNWTREDLISRLHQLESAPSHSQKPSQSSTSDPSFAFFAHPRRKIALKFCYAGAEYNGLAFQKDYTPLPTVEGVLFDALARTRLIDPDKGFEGCGWERCGRTDRGVSAAGQVISLWVRSTIGSSNTDAAAGEPETSTAVSTNSSPTESLTEDEDTALPLMEDLDPPFSSCVQHTPTARSHPAEILYITVLNRVLPTTIRILAWSPVAPAFSARFACQFRHYKYFFPAPPELDIARMQDAAARLVGTHDFRNLCTLDGSKQIDNYHRAIRRADISQVSPDPDEAMGGGPMCVLDLVGTAFLYNQVRSIMAVLFLVGAGLEPSHIVSSLLNVDLRVPRPPYRPDEPITIVDRKPSYQMADALPLVLWDAGYSEDEVRWRTEEDPASGPLDKEATTTNLRHQMLSIYNRARISTTLDGHFLRAAAAHHAAPYTPFPLPPSGKPPLSQKIILNVPVGGGMHIRTAKYKPLLTRERGESAEVVNERWRLGRGKKRWEERVLAKERAAGMELTGTADADE